MEFVVVPFIVAAIAIIAMHLFDNYMTRSSRPAPTGLQVAMHEDSPVVTWNSAGDDSIVGYEYDYASFGIPIFVIPTWKSGTWIQRTGTEATLYGPDDKKIPTSNRIEVCVSDVPKFPVYGKEIRVRFVYEDGMKGRYASASIQDL